MLRFILGAAGTGKTFAVQREILCRAEEGRRSLLLVPEQFSWQAEHDIYRLLGDRKSAFVQVFSFTALAREVEKRLGGGAAPVLSDAGRCVFIRRAIDLLGDEVCAYGRHRRDSAFYSLCSDAIKELKSAGIGPQQLYRAALGGGEEYRRLAELALIFGEYEASVAGRYEDEADRLSRAAQKADAAFFGDAAVFVDSFDGFTAPEYAMLSHCIAARGGCTVALTCDALLDHTGGLGLFAHTQKTAADLISLAKNKGVELAPVELYQTPRRFHSAGLLQLDAFLRGGALPTSGEGVFVTGYRDPYEEARAVSAQLRRLAVEENIPYEKMAVVCPDMGDYVSHFRRLSAQYDLPFFVDETDSAEHTAPVAFLRAALSLLRRGLNTPDLLLLLKTDLTPFSSEEIASLENYLYTWQIQYGSGWASPFKNNPEGFSAKMGPRQQKELARAERVRAAVYPLAQGFVETASSTTGEELAKQLYLLMEAFGAPAAAAKKADELALQGREALAAAQRRIWNVTMGFLDEMAALLGDDKVQPKEFDELFLLLVRSSDVGAQPQNIAAVTLASAGRMRLAGPEVVFVVGVGEGRFPACAEPEGLLTQTDRELLERAGLETQGSYLNCALRENLSFYKALTASSGRLYLSFSSKGGEVQSLTSAVARFAAAAGCRPLILPPAAKSATPRAALFEYQEMWLRENPEKESLAAALRIGAPEALSRMEKAALPPEGALRDLAALRGVLGGALRISPSRAESYFNCRFGYYLQYVLRLRTRRKAELSPIESGSFIHYVLENAMRSAGEGLQSYSQAQIFALASSVADQYVAENMQGEVADTRRFRALLARLKEASAKLLCHIAAEQAQSAFRPEGYEVEIGEGGVPPLCLTTPAGDEVQVIGKIDRLDVMQAGKKRYLRVVDYKTGTKRFSLDDVFYGLNTQMLLYLFTVCAAGKDKLGQTVPAGVLYLLGDPPPKTGERRAEPGPAFQTDGLILKDETVLRGMEKGGEGLFIPVRYKKDGSPSAASSLASLAEMGRIEQHIEGLLLKMAEGLYEGDIAPQPVRGLGHNPCQYCDYLTVCRHREGFSERTLTKPEHPFEEEEQP